MQVQEDNELYPVVYTDKKIKIKLKYNRIGMPENNVGGKILTNSTEKRV